MQVNHPHLKVWACSVRNMGNWLTRRHKDMQKLEERNTYTPMDVPQVRGNCDPALNVEETLSVLGLKTSSNNSDAALTGFGSSRAYPTGICCKNSPLLTTEHDCRYRQIYTAFIPCLKGRGIHAREEE